MGKPEENISNESDKVEESHGDRSASEDGVSSQQVSGKSKEEGDSEAKEAKRRKRAARKAEKESKKKKKKKDKTRKKNEADNNADNNSVDKLDTAGDVVQDLGVGTENPQLNKPEENISNESDKVEESHGDRSASADGVSSQQVSGKSKEEGDSEAKEAKRRKRAARKAEKESKKKKKKERQDKKKE